MRVQRDPETRRSPAAAYFAQIRNQPLLDPDAERRLCEQYARSRDPELMRVLARANLRLVVKMARELRAPWLLSDLIQEGNLGLLHAIELFDPARGVRLATYAGWWIRAYMLHYLCENCRLVPATRTREGRKQFFRGELPAPEISLEAPLHDGTSLSEKLPGADECRPDRAIEKAETRHLVARAVADLAGDTASPREHAIISERFLTEAPCTLKDLGRRFSVSRERMRQLESGLLSQLGNRLRAAAA